MVAGPEDTSVLNAIRSEVREMRDQSLNLNVIGLQKALEETEKN